jgi:hypothetical protein
MRPNPSWLLPPLAAGGAFAAPSVGAGSGFYPNLDWKWFDSDGWYNYDFTEKTIQAAKVDWPVNMVWGNDGDIDDVKSYLLSKGWSGAGQGELRARERLQEPQTSTGQIVPVVPSRANGEVKLAAASAPSAAGDGARTATAVIVQCRCPTGHSTAAPPSAWSARLSLDGCPPTAMVLRPPFNPACSDVE